MRQNVHKWKTIRTYYMLSKQNKITDNMIKYCVIDSCVVNKANPNNVSYTSEL